MLSPRTTGVARVRLLGGFLAAALAFVACTVVRTPAAVGPPFVRIVRVARVYELPALSPPAWGPGADALTVGTGDGVWEIPLGGDTPRRLASIGRVTAVAWGPGRASLAAVADGTVYTLSPSAASAVPVAGSSRVALVQWAPRTARLAYVERGPGQDELVLTSGGRAGQALRVLLPSGFTARSLAWLPDGQNLLIAGGPPDDPTSTRLLRVSLTRNAPKVTSAETGTAMSGPAIDPSGRQIAYVGAASDAGAAAGGAVMVSRLDGTGRRTLTGRGTYTGLAWAPSGTSLAFGEILAPDRVAVEIINAATGARLQVAEYRPELPQATPGLAIRWAPDGLRLAFGTDTGDSPGPVWVATLARE